MKEYSYTIKDYTLIFFMCLAFALSGFMFGAVYIAHYYVSVIELPLKKEK